MKNLRYFAIYKPFGVLSQFTDADGHPGIGSIVQIPKDVYPVGRLDRDSEGLLLLTNDTQLNHKLLNPKFEHWRTYLVQVEGISDESKLKQLEKGVKIRINKKDYFTKPCKSEILPEPDWLPERHPPIRFRKTVPTSWISLSLTEGKNRQVRKMTASIGYPTLRLVRHKIENLTLPQCIPGELFEFTREEIYQKLGLQSSTS